MKNTEQLQKFFEDNGFNVHLTEQDGAQCAEVESWTNGGVDMNIWLNPFTEDEFISFVNDFDIDEEIELHRQDPRYKADFTISRSLSDFKAYYKMLNKVAKAIKKATS